GSVRNVVAIGEALTGYLQARFHATLPRATLWNSYGPTEAAVGVTLWRCRREDGERAPPIGAPSWNTRLYILDDDLHPVATGDTGELFIAGLPLARGYHGRPELTAETFLPCPFEAPGTRMYRTGDLAVRGEDGEIEFLGRGDSQVKFNGIRIELGEIEAAVAGLPGVARAAVIARTLPHGARLIAYVVMRPGAACPAMPTIREALGATLPRYMIPSFVVPLEALPMTASGKLDARALPDPAADDAPGAFRAPANALEALLARLFGDLTGARNVGVDHSFFDLGGTSLTAMRLAARLKATNGMILPMRALVEYPTPAGLAAALTRVDGARHTSLPNRARPAVFVFPGAGGDDLSLAAPCEACDPAVDMVVLDYPDWRPLCRPGAGFEALIASFVRTRVWRTSSCRR
ncbi:MAG: non-ribosomal peptide synthetase, partial [Caulobacteraceae bacterium]